MYQVDNHLYEAADIEGATKFEKFRYITLPMIRPVFIFSIMIIIIWSLRLGSFLFMRILKDKEDRRFNEWKFSFALFLRTWTLQGMWIFLTSIAAITAISTRKIVAPDILLFVGGFLWLFGFLFETISDFQKRKFKSKNKDGFLEFWKNFGAVL